MTRFEQEWSGMLGEFWMKHAHEEAERMMAKRSEIEVEADGAAKWISSGNYLPAHVVEILTFAGADFFDAEATKAKREAQNEASIAAYKASRKAHKVTAEERYEMQAAFGRGARVVDIITGEVISL